MNHTSPRVVTILLAAVVTACGARVPANFIPSPPRLTPTDIAVENHRDADEVVVLVFGDAGSGSDDQREVGRRMSETCDVADCDLALMLGDNFYNRGVSPPKNGQWDSAFDRKFEQPYEDLGRLDMWAVAGNHDWFKGRNSIDTQVAYSEHSERWRMLGYDYAVPHLPEWLHIYGLDTVIIDNGVRIGQLDRANAALCDTTGWKILFGHHAVFTSGHHANRNGVVPRVEQALVPLIETCGVDLLLSGHDHHQEHLIADSFHQIIQGAAGKLRSVGRRASDHEATQAFAAGKYGFAILRIRREAIGVTFYGYEQGRPETFEVIYETSIKAEDAEDEKTVRPTGSANRGPGRR